MARKPRPKKNDFKIGDMVRFIGNAENEFDVTFGKVYVVNDVKTIHDCLVIFITDDAGEDNSLYYKDVELVTDGHYSMDDGALEYEEIMQVQGLDLAKIGK